MHHVAGSTSVRVAVGAVALAVLSTLGPSAAATGPTATGPTAAGPTDPVPYAATERADPLLAEPAGGVAAVRELGSRLPAAAAVNDLTARRLETLLRTDATARLTTDGRLHYVEPIPEDLPEDPPTRTVPSPRTADTAGAAGAAGAASDAFALHSNPGALRSIFLDFDGHTVAGSSWNTQYAMPTAAHPAWDPARDGAAFSASERAMVEQVWSMVSEDFAPYDVDVTTQDPGTSGLERSGLTDQTYGTRALISPSSTAWSAICGQQCGGVAFLSVYDTVGTTFQPAWVFPQGLGDSPKAIAEATSHEVGHNLALQHHGITGNGYYAGHGSWAPIMGVGYDRPITQWSKGEYAGATNRQDDLAVIGDYLARRVDEVGGPAPRTGYVTSDADVDVFTLGRCSSGSRVTVGSAYAAPDLDVRARLLSADGTVLATAEPPSGTVDATRAYGMDATLTVPADARYSVEVTGTGGGPQVGDPTTGYSAYGSTGAYQVTAGGCDRDLAGVPTKPEGLAEDAPATTSTLQVRWTPPSDSGAAPVTGYTVTAVTAAAAGTPGPGASLSLGPDARTATLTGLAAGTDHDVTVTAVNARGPGVPASLRLRTAAAPTTVPTAPRSVTGLWNADLQRPEVYWQAPDSDGGSPVTGYDLTVDGASFGLLPATWSAVGLGGTFAPGTHTVSIAAVNALGPGPAGTSTFTVPGPPADTEGPVTSDFDFTPRSVDVSDGARQVTVSARLTDATGARAPVVTVTSDTTDQTLGSGSMARVSGTAQDGRYERTVTVPATAAAGSWSVTLQATSDTLGNRGDASRDHPEKLTVVRADPATAPGAPTGVVATPGDARAQVSWTAPASDGGAPITSYTVTGTPGGATAVVAGDQRTATVVGLSNGTAHTFTVTATSTAGTGSPSAPSDPVTPTAPPAAPGAPTGVGATAGAGQATVRWEAPTDDGRSPLTGYTVTTTDGGVTATVGADSTTATLTGLTNGTSYRFVVTAVNAVGGSPASAPSNAVTPVAAPDRMARPTVSLRGTTATVGWRPAAANGSPVTGYTVRVSGERARQVAATARTVVVKGISRGRHTVRVTATNAVGTSVASGPARIRVR